MPEEITLENLAEKMDEGFKKVDKRFGEAEIHFDKKIDEKIDQLALAVAKGFNEVDERFNEVDERFNEVDERFNEVDERFDKVDEKFGNVNARLDIIETDVKDIKQKMVLSERHNDLKTRVDLLEEKAGIVS